MNSPSLRLIATLGTLAAVAATTATATLLTYEDFNYTSAANITGQTGGSGWRSPSNPAWNTAGTTGTVAASGLSYTGINASYTAFASSGLAANLGGVFRNDRYLALDAGGAYALAGLKGSGTHVGGTGVTGTLWGSFLVSGTAWTGGSGSQMIFNLSTAAGGTGTSIRQTGTGANIALTDTSGTNTIGATGSILASSLSTVNPNLFVFRYDFNSAGNDTLNVWLNPTSASDTASISATATDFAIQNPEIRSVNANGGLVFDEIRFGTTFADVVPVSAIPEPSTYAALAGLGVLGLAATRRRRS